MHLSKADASTGAMVALYPSPDVAAQLAQPGGETAEQLHVTLAYLGPAANIEDPEALKRAVAEFAARTVPIAGTVSGTGHFTGGETPVTYASVDLPTLAPARERLVYDLASYWGSLSREHGFTPHITLAYADLPVTVPNLPVVFEAVSLVIAGDRTDFPFYGTYAEWVVPLWKADDGVDDEPMILYGVVLQPGIPDSQGDTLTADEIEKAAHRYLIESRKNDVQHDGVVAPVDVVESFIAPMDMVLADHPVVKGAWVMATSVRDAVVKADVRAGRITGYSIGGTGVRT
jgi:2'-5' RNA ligase